MLIISVTPCQRKHIIGQWGCRRNIGEARIVLLKIWRELCPLMFAPGLTGSFCQRGHCLEGKMTRGKKLVEDTMPEAILNADYPALCTVCHGPHRPGSSLHGAPPLAIHSIPFIYGGYHILSDVRVSFPSGVLRQRILDSIPLAFREFYCFVPILTLCIFLFVYAIFRHK